MADWIAIFCEIRQEIANCMHTKYFYEDMNDRKVRYLWNACQETIIKCCFELSRQYPAVLPALLQFYRAPVDHHDHSGPINIYI